MENILAVLVLVLIVTLIAILILFQRQGKRLKEEIDRAVESEGIKSTYLMDVSQNFRGPLESIMADCEHLLEKESVKADGELLETVKEISNNSRQLYQYANEIKEFSNMEGNIPNSTKIEVNLIELIMSYRREILHFVQKNVQVNLHTEMSPHVRVWLDTTVFRQLIMHLLRSAALETKKGAITISYETENQGLRFTIDNTCDPVPQEIVDTLFTDQIDPANQIKQLSNKDIILSMSVCKSIIDNYKGTIQASSIRTDHSFHMVISFWIPCTLNMDD